MKRIQIYSRTPNLTTQIKSLDQRIDVIRSQIHFLMCANKLGHFYKTSYCVNLCSLQPIETKSCVDMNNKDDNIKKNNDENKQLVKY